MRRSVTSGLKALNYLSRDTSTATDFNAIGFGPLSDGLGINLAGWRRLPRAPAAYLAAMGNEFAQAVAEPIGIAIGHVDLVLDAIKGKSNGLSRVRAVDVVLESRQNLSRHGGSFFPECAG
jgi:hypothetical protein